MYNISLTPPPHHSHVFPMPSHVLNTFEGRRKSAGVWENAAHDVGRYKKDMEKRCYTKSVMVDKMVRI